MNGGPRLIALNKLGELRNVNPMTYQIIQELQNQINRYIVEQASQSTPGGGGGGGGSAASPLTDKGDIWGFDADDNRIPVGADGEVLTADAASALGVKYAPKGGVTGIGVLGTLTGNVGLSNGAGISIVDNSPVPGFIEITNTALPALYVSPLTDKGDIFAFDTADDRFPVGADGEILAADSTKAFGLDWVARGGFIIEQPAGVIDGVNADFVLSKLPSSSRILLFPDLILAIGGVDYTRVGTAVHFVSLARKPARSLIAAYPYDGLGDGGGTPEAPPPNGTADNWTLESIETKTWTSVAWSPTLRLFAATENVTGHIATSPDGVVWTVYTSAIDDWTEITWGNGQFLAVQDTSSEHVAISTDGVTWSRVPATHDTGFVLLSRVLWAEGFSLYIGLAAGYFWNSSDGVAWTRGSVVTDHPQAGFAHALGLGLAVAVGNGALYTSTDGVNWTLQTNPFGANPVKSVCWSPDLGLFCVSTSGPFYLSSDGINWTGHTQPGSRWYGSVVWSATRRIFVAGCDGNSIDDQLIAWSPDGVNWTEVTPPVTTGSAGWNLLCAADDPDIIVAFGPQASGRTQLAARCLS